MFSELRKWLERRRTISFVRSVGGWYKTCAKLTESLGDVLYDQRSPEAEVGLIIGAADRLIFQLGDYHSDVLGLLRRTEPGLAKRVDLVSQQVCRLRNETAHFLIQCQGPERFEDRQETGMRHLYYYRAMEKAGFAARRIQTDLEKELKLLWRDLQKPIQLAERSLAVQPIPITRRR